MMNHLGFKAYVLALIIGSTGAAYADSEVFSARYLKTEDLPQALALLPPPPMDYSPSKAFDTAVNKSSYLLKDTPRWQLATSDANLHFPAAATVFSCALNVDIQQETMPYLYRVLQRTLSEAHFSSLAAKEHYKRKRPFVVNHKPSCTPADEDKLRSNGSYPSVHAAAGWAWALLLSELAAVQSEAILARGRAFGQSSVICNVHWQSDVIEGRFIGAAILATLHSDANFIADMQGAKEELSRAQGAAAGSKNNCKAEAAALAIMPKSPWPANR
jgi:acid phosphatase (class A)